MMVRRECLITDGEKSEENWTEGPLQGVGKGLELEGATAERVS